jgi:signal transduction histidine kinase/CheY-like chemotaxis protein
VTLGAHALPMEVAPGIAPSRVLTARPRRFRGAAGIRDVTPIRQRRFHVTLTVALALSVGVIASIAGYAMSRDSLRDANNELLRGDAAQGSLVLSSFISEITSPFKELGAAVTTPDPSPAAFDAAAGKLSGSSGAAIALLRVSHGQLSVVASVGRLHRSFAPSRGSAAIISLGAKPNLNFLGAFVASGKRWIQEVYGQGYVPAGYVMYSEQPISTANSVTQLPGVLFSGTVAAAYVGSVSSSTLALQTSTALPSGPELAWSAVSNSGQLDSDAVLTSDPTHLAFPGRIIVVMSPQGDLAGSFVAKDPWILLVVGLLATLVVSALLGTAISRREEALGLVGDLERKNTELDESMSRQAQAEQSLRQAQRMEAVGQLAGGIAHDFNNLLQAIISYSEFISDGLDADSEMQQDVAEVQKAAHRAAELTKQLLVFSRQDVAEPVVVDLNTVVRDSERFLSHTLGEDVALTCHTAREPRCVRADTGELEMVLINLAINARDAMPHGGSLWITVGDVQLNADAAAVAGLAPGHYAKVSVEDNGEGMSPEVSAKAFEPFFTTKETGRGTGLGLAMVYGIAKRWGGGATISTAKGVGTTVTLLFPLSDEDATSEDARAARVLPRGDRDIALLVEDQEGVRRSTARILEAAGFQVLQAENAVEAASKYAATAFDILVTDVIMPEGVSGKELADHFRTERPELPVIFISGYSTETISQRGILPPSTNLVTKPFSPEDLLHAMCDAMGKSVLSPA